MRIKASIKAKATTINCLKMTQMRR